MKDIKRAGNNWINENELTKSRFEWQEGYGAFSYSRSHISRVCKYIEDQEQHHTVTTFREEYTKLLKAFEIEYRDEYLFQFYD